MIKPIEIIEMKSDPLLPGLLKFYEWCDQQVFFGRCWESGSRLSTGKCKAIAHLYALSLSAKNMYSWESKISLAARQGLL